MFCLWSHVNQSRGQATLVGATIAEQDAQPASGIQSGNESEYYSAMAALPVSTVPSSMESANMLPPSEIPPNETQKLLPSETRKLSTDEDQKQIRFTLSRSNLSPRAAFARVSDTGIPVMQKRISLIAVSMTGIASISILAMMFGGNGGTSAGGGRSSQPPPAWSPERESTYPFRNWTQDLLAWSVVNSHLDPSQRAANILLQLSGSARELLRHMSYDELTQGGWVNGQSRSSDEHLDAPRDALRPTRRRDQDDRHERTHAVQPETR